MGDSLPPDLDTDLARFGHTAVMNNGTMYLHGGFHGVLKNDLLAFVPGQCRMYKNKTACLKSLLAGVKCVWDSKKGLCEKHPPNRPKSSKNPGEGKSQSDSFHHINFFVLYRH